MITAVLDANVLVSGITGFAIDTSVLGAILRSWRDGDFELVVSEHVIEEVVRTLEKPYFRRRLSSREITRVVQLLRHRARHTPITHPVSGVATHPEDDLVLASAVSGGATYLVTGDQHLQRIGDYLGVTIVSPRAFLQILH